MNRALPVALALALTGAGCAGKIVDPLLTIAHPCPTTERADTLIVMLPGIGDRAGTYQKHGFVAALHAAGAQVDIVEVDAHWGYYKQRTLPRRLAHDVLAPARERYDQVWIVGISLGGFGAVLTAGIHPEQIDGMILMAPYLGPRETSKAIAEAGGLAAWEPPAEIDPDKDWSVDLWRTLDRITDAPADDTPEIYLLYGTGDMGVVGHDLLAAELPPDHVMTTAGGHSWRTWTRLWTELIDSPRPWH